MSARNIERLGLITLSLFFSSGLMAAERGYSLTLSQSGAEAKAIYDGLKVPEEKDEMSSTAYVSTTYKVGRNFLCIKTVKNYGRIESMSTYICSAGFDSAGKSEQRKDGEDTKIIMGVQCCRYMYGVKDDCWTEGAF